MLSCNFGRAIFVLAINLCLQLVERQPAALEVAKSLILIIRANFAKFNESSHHGPFGDPSHANSCPNRAALDEAIYDLGARFGIEPVQAVTY